jgi:hypothetical protein
MKKYAIKKHVTGIGAVSIIEPKYRRVGQVRPALRNRQYFMFLNTMEYDRFRTIKAKYTRKYFVVPKNMYDDVNAHAQRAMANSEAAWQEIAPDATGRIFFLGCNRSSSTSVTALIVYIPPYRNTLKDIYRQRWSKSLAERLTSLKSTKKKLPMSTTA